MTLGDKLRGNASLLTAALRGGTLKRPHLFALAADLLEQAGEADRLAEAQAWLAEEARGDATHSPHMKTAPRQRGRLRSRKEYPAMEKLQGAARPVNGNVSA